MAERCMIIAEVAQAHDGSLGTAHNYIDAAVKAGADAVKFQMHFAAEESTPSEPWRVKFSKQDASRYDYWKRMEFTESQWFELKSHCDAAGVAFICSPFSLKAVELLKEIGVPAWKVASGEVFSEGMLDAMSETGLPMLVSTGMIGWSDIREVVRRIQSRDLPLTLFQCTSAYPTPASKVGLNVLEQFKTEFGCEVGLSDHSGKIFAGLAAATLGISALEVHIAWHRGSFGPDVPASLTLEEFAVLVEGVREIETMRANPVDKDLLAEEMSPMRALFSKSLVVRTPKSVGEVIQFGDLVAKKPGTGIAARRMDEFVGRTVSKPLEMDHLLEEKDVA